MSVGIPGTGIGGLFYLISGFLMPVRELVLAWRGGPARAGIRRLVVRQTLMVLGILAGIWTAGWMLGLLIVQSPAVVSALGGPVVGRQPASVWGAAAVLTGLVTLLLVLCGVEVARLLVRTRAPAIPQGRPVGGSAASSERRQPRACGAGGAGGATESAWDAA